MSERMIVNRVKKLKALEEQKAQLEKEYEKLKADIQNAMEGKEEVKAGLYIIRWTRTKTSRLDTATLKELYPLTYRECLKATESRRFSVTEV